MSRISHDIIHIHISPAETILIVYPTRFGGRKEFICFYDVTKSSQTLLIGFCGRDPRIGMVFPGELVISFLDFGRGCCARKTEYFVRCGIRGRGPSEVVGRSSVAPAGTMEFSRLVIATIYRRIM